MNEALSTSTDRLGFTTAGILATSAHAHSSPSHPRTISYIAAHPERDVDRWSNPSQLDKAIFLADAIAGQTTTKYNKQFIDHKPHTLILENILAELLPIGVWHMRHTSQLNITVLDLPWKYQHQFQLTQYLYKRDQYGPPHSQRWQGAEIDFAACVHPIPRAGPASCMTGWVMDTTPTRDIDRLTHKSLPQHLRWSRVSIAPNMMTKPISC